MNNDRDENEGPVKPRSDPKNPPWTPGSRGRIWGSRGVFLAVFLALGLPGAARADTRWAGWGWTRSDVALEVAFDLVVLADWSQTLSIVEQGRRECNPVLGPFPSKRRVNALIPVGMLAHALVSVAMPRGMRRMWQVVTIGFEVDAVRRNYRAGVGLSLQF